MLTAELIAEEIHLDNHHATHLDKNVPPQAQSRHKKGLMKSQKILTRDVRYDVVE
jgi:hypothetical protein